MRKLGNGIDCAFAHVSVAVNSRVYKSSTSTTIVDWNEADTTFDLDGNVYRTWGKEGGDATTNSTERTYDLWDRAAEVKYPQVTDVSSGNVRYTETTTFFLDGGVDLRTDRNGDTPALYTYDAQGRTTQVRRENSGATQRYDTDYTFNSTGELTQVDFPDGGQQKYTYDEIGRRRQL